MTEQLRLKYRKAADKKAYRPDRRQAERVDRQVGSIFAGTYLELVDEDQAAVFIVQRNSQRSITKKIGTDSTALFDLASAASTEDGALKFANKWGLLDSNEMELSDFCRVSAVLWNYLHLMSAGRWAEVSEQLAGATLNAGQIRFEDDGRTAYQEPRNLRHFCFLHLAKLVEQRAEIMCCPRPGCRGFYHRKGRRRACSPTCTKAIHKRRARDRKKAPNNDEMDVVARERIAALWRERCDILVVPDLKRTYISPSEAKEPLDEEFIKRIGAWMNREES